MDSALLREGRFDRKIHVKLPDVAEVITYHDASSGAASDLKEASRLALAMVANLSLGDKGRLFSMDTFAAFNIQPDTMLVIAEAEGVLASQNER